MTSIDYFRSGRWRANELISLALPIYYSLFFLMLVLGLVFLITGKAWGFVLILASAVFMSAPIALLAIRTALARGQGEKFISLFLVYSVYIAARTRAIFSFR